MGRDVPECFAEVVALARKGGGDERIYVAGTVIGFGPVAIPFLVELLGDPYDMIRLRAARSLGQLGPDARPATPHLVRALGDSSEYVKTAARDALSKIDPERYPEKQAD
jgi:hypothetical protein